MNTRSVHQLEWTPPDGGVWQHDASHQTGPVTTAFAEIMPRCHAEGMKQAFAEIGLPLSHVAIEYVNGWAYVSIFVHGAPRSAGGPPPEPVLKLLNRVVPGARRRNRVAAEALTLDRPMDSVARWDGMRDGWIERVLEVSDVDAEQLDDNQLADFLGRVFALASEGLEVHFGLMTAAAVFGEYLVAAERWGLEADQARAVVMHGVPVHQEAWARMERLVAAIGPVPVANPADIRRISDEAANALDDYLRFHGSWATADDLHGPTLMEQPGLLMKAVAAHRPVPGTHRKIRASLAAQVPSGERGEFERLADRAQRAHAAMEDNSALLASWPFGVLGRAMRIAAERLALRGVMGSVEEVWTVSVGELRELLTGTSPLGPDDLADRLAERRVWCEATPPPFLNGEPSPPPDPSVFPPAVAHWVAAIGAFVDNKLGSLEASGVGQETVQGRAVVVDTAFEAFERIEPGDVLVTRATTPAFNAVLPILGGLVTSDGGAASHAAVMARELELPAVVGLRGATEEIPDGALVEIDPARATVRVVEATTTV